MSASPTWLILLLGFGLLYPGSAYRLNVPRLLLPYHPTISVTFDLEVAAPTGGCFNWRSNRPDVVSVTPIGNGECSDRAQVTSRAKTPGLHSAVIFAEDSNGGTTLSCGVTVDDVASIAIEHTTKILYVDAAPAPITAIAYNSEGDKFSTLGEIPFEWELSAENSDKRPLRIVPFEQSKYRAPDEIQALESAKKKGYLILLEGLVTGSSLLQAKFSDQYFEKVDHHSLDLVVVANLLLTPSYDLYVPVLSKIDFEVWIVKEQSTEEVSMPSSAYYLQLDNQAICSLNKKTSSVTALKKGIAELSLLTQNVDAKASKSGAVRPPSTKIHVVDPESLQFAISGNNWLLETGRTYKVYVNLLDPHGNYMFIADNTRFDTVLSLDFFDIHFNSKNGTYFEVTPKKSGKTTLKSKFRAIIQGDGIETLIDRRVTGEQLVEVVEPIQVVPAQIAFPYLPRAKFEYSLKAVGGSGVFVWTSSNTAVSGVDESSGLLKSGDVGVSTITAFDRRNKKHFATAEVSVLDVFSLSFGKTPKEAEEGQLLTLNVQLFGMNKDGQQTALTDCRSVPFSVEIHDQRVFQHMSKIQSEIPREGTGCGTVTLRALQSGDTKVVVKYDKYRATIDVSAYPALKASISSEVLLGVGSQFAVRIEGGPRPWILDSSRFFTEGSVVDQIAAVNIDDKTATITCGNKEGSTTFSIRVGNEPVPSNELPASSVVKVPLCCAIPTRLILSTDRPAHRTNLPNCPPSARTLFVSSASRLSLTGYGRCSGGEERKLDSIQGLDLKWSIDKNKLMKIKQEEKKTDESKLFAIATPQGTSGAVRVSVEAASTTAGRLAAILRASLDLKLVDRVMAQPSQLVLWNEPTAIGTINLKGGSGYFFILDKKDEFDTRVDQNKIIVTPRQLGKTSIRLVDTCIDDSVLEIPVKITDIHALSIRAPQHLEVEKQTEITVEVVDENGEPFPADYVTLMQLNLDSSNDFAELTKIDSVRYRMRARTVGTVVLSASARSSTGKTLKSRAHTVQIFAPIQLFPKEVTLIPESTFQLEVIGGPQPTPPISFALNNSKICTVQSNALITSQDIGYSLVTGTVQDGDGRNSKDSVIVKVVSLNGIRLVLSTHSTEVGGKVWARLQGIADDETPFSFGGALYPFKVTWSLNHANIATIKSPLGKALSEQDQNRFAVWLSATGPGKVVVSATVELHKYAKKHFKIKDTSMLRASADITVDELVGLVDPSLQLGSMRIAPESETPIKTNWPESKVSWSVPKEFSGRLSVSKSGRLRTFSTQGPAALLLKRDASGVNKTNLVPVQISPAAIIDVVLSPSLTAPTDVPLTALPVGLSITLNVQFRDAFGVLLHAAPNAINYRPHRFDLTTIVATNTNRTLTITLKSPGETVLRLWDPQEPSLSTFIRLGARDQLTPTTQRPMVVSDIVCFNSPIEGGARWSVSNDRLQLIDGRVGVAKHAGQAHVSVETDDGQKMHSTVSVYQPNYLAFVNSPHLFVTNVDAAKFVFPVQIARNPNETIGGSAIGCSKLSEVDGLRAPFQCELTFAVRQPVLANVLFSSKAIFSADKSSYVCVIEKQIAANVQFPASEYKQPTDLIITAKWNVDGQQLESTMKVPFHVAFEIVDSELSLSNLDQESALIGVRVAPASLKHIKARGCGEDSITLQETKPSYPHGSANKHFKVKLNVKQASMWQDKNRDKKCVVVIESTETGQIAKVPVDIRLVGPASKHVYDALDSSGFIDFVFIVIHRYAWMIPSLMLVCFIAIATILVYQYLQKPSSKSGVAALNTTGIFASDPPSANVSMQSSPAASPVSSLINWRHMTPKYTSTPLDVSSMSSPGSAGSLSPSAYQSPRVGSKGPPGLWSTDSRKRHV